MSAGSTGREEILGQRLDKWLWFARVVKTRSLAARLILAGKVRVNRERTDKPSLILRPGAVVTVLVAGRVRILKVVAPGRRRGPPADAHMLYEDLTPPRPAPETHNHCSDASRSPVGGGRPTKRQRRQIERLKSGSA
ncbi:MAG TPA: RNA-binding S4 domain-containing protein [Hyphomicrobiaceae bacterium]|nr:RNA-binding S4 domain-containing protein [Hyphomicrobiaceae bacterium]